MVDLKSKAMELIKHLCGEKILCESKFDSLNNQTFDDVILPLKRALQETYPQTKLKPIMRSIHYSNNFTDERLKENALLLDEIEQYLVINKFLDHDISVAYLHQGIL